MDSDIINNFNEILEDIVEGRRTAVPTCTLLDRQTIRILNILAAQRKKTAKDIMACRVEFGRMLDGTHAVEDQIRDDAEWDFLLGGN